MSFHLEHFFLKNDFRVLRQVRESDHEGDKILYMFDLDFRILFMFSWSKISCRFKLLKMLI